MRLVKAVCLSLLCLCVALQAAEPATVAASAASDAPRICKYRGDCHAALSFSFDDGYKDHLAVAAPLLEKYGLRGTFFIIAGTVGVNPPNPKPNTVVRLDWAGVKELHTRGHEVANHTMTHAGVRNLNAEGWTSEVQAAQKLLEDKTGTRPLTFCFPGNGSTPEALALVMQTHLAARTRCIGYGGPRCTLATMNANLDKLIAENDDNVAMVHALLPGSGYEPFSDIALFEEHLKYVKSKEAALWVDTFLNVTKYKLNRDRCDLKTAAQDGKEWRFSLASKEGQQVFTDTTLTIALPAAATKETVATQNGQPLNIVRKDGRAYIEVAPNSAEVTVRL